MSYVIIIGLITLLSVSIYMYNEQKKKNEELNKKRGKK